MARFFGEQEVRRLVISLRQIRHSSLGWGARILANMGNNIRKRFYPEVLPCNKHTAAAYDGARRVEPFPCRFRGTVVHLHGLEEIDVRNIAFSIHHCLYACRPVSVENPFDLHFRPVVTFQFGYYATQVVGEEPCKHASW